MLSVFRKINLYSFLLLKIATANGKQNKYKRKYNHEIKKINLCLEIRWRWLAWDIYWSMVHSHTKGHWPFTHMNWDPFRFFIFCTCQVFSALLPHQVFANFETGDFKNLFQIGIGISTKIITELYNFAWIENDTRAWKMNWKMNRHKYI